MPVIERRLGQLMKLRGFKSAYQLAKVTGLTEEGLKKLLYEKTNGISFETLDRLCEALQCEVGSLLIYKKGSVKRSKTNLL